MHHGASLITTMAVGLGLALVLGFAAVRTHSEEEAALLRNENAGTVFLGEHELAMAMTRFVMEKVAAPARA